MSKQPPESFLQVVWEYYDYHGRHNLPWRQIEPDGTIDPYKILVSEIMLQQTQVQRVIPKYQAFLMAFPTVDSLAHASLGQVLTLWSGLGYNRRAKFLWQAAQVIQETGKFPTDVDNLVRLPGVGRNTAGAIMAYTYNQPSLFIETNIRTVYIHHFFQQQTAVTDAEILEKLATTLDATQPRAFYWALMDYGSHLKQVHGNLSKLSKSYAKQSTFNGSQRQIRGQVIKRLTSKALTFAELAKIIDDPRLIAVLDDLQREQLITQVAGSFQLS